MPQLIADRYELGSLIGRGAMGDVYRGRDAKTGVDIAIKALKPELLSTNAEIAARFTREGELLRRLNHPNIVTTQGSYQEGEQHYIVMEYVSGGSLRDLIRNQSPLPVQRVLEIALEISDALARVHQMGIIHRDIKPANVLIAQDGTPRLSDFGVAHVNDGTRITETGLVFGTYAYISPEACFGEPLDARTDIWSFGVMLYEMLTSEVPFHETTPAAMITAILAKQPTNIRELRPDIPEALAELVHRMLEKDRNLRIESARQVGAIIEGILRGHPTPIGGSLPTPPTPLPIEVPRHNLPPQPTPFVGRYHEIAEIARTLDDPGCRMLTLLGTGGIGKTRLALEVAARKVSDFQQGVFFVPLAPVTDLEFVIPAIADAIGYTFYSGSEGHRTQLMNYLHNKHMLLVLDNFEHILDAADLVAEILTVAPHIKLLITSRELLNLQEEWVRHVRGMSFPDHDDTSQFDSYSAVKLFIESAQRTRADFDADAERPHMLKILQLVQGMPLAIELATAWLRILTCEQIVQEIEASLDFLATNRRNVAERHRSLRAVFDYSWDLLERNEQQALKKLAVFKGGFNREAAQQVAGATFFLLSSLIDKSMVQQVGPNRYDMHMLVTQYASEKLNEDAAVATKIQSAHSAHYLDVLHQAEPKLKGAEQIATLETLDKDVDNIRQAWKWAAQQHDYTHIGAALLGFHLFYSIRNWYWEEGALLEMTIENLESANPTPEQLQVLGQACLWRGAMVAVRSMPYLQRAQKLLENSRPDLKFVYHFLGIHPRTDDDERLGLLEESLTISEELNDDWGILFTCNSLGDHYARRLGDFARARTYYERALSLGEKIGNRAEMAYTFNSLGDMAWIEGNYAAGCEPYCKALEIFKEFKSSFQLGLTSFNLGDMYFELGDYDQAAGCYRDAVKLTESLGVVFLQHQAHARLGDIAQAHGDNSSARHHYQQGIAIAQQADITSPQSARGLGHLALKEGDFTNARVYFREQLAALRHSNYMGLLTEALLPFAELAIAEGDRVLAGELLVSVYNHPTSRSSVQQQAQHLIEQYANHLSPDIIDAMRNGHYNDDLDGIVNHLLDEG